MRIISLFLELLNEEVIVILMTQFIVFFDLCTLEVRFSRNKLLIILLLFDSDLRSVLHVYIAEMNRLW